MLEVLRHPSLQIALWLAGILVVSALAIAALVRWRGGAADDRPRARELLMKFRELHARGGLSDNEYRTIKTKLARRFPTELSDDE
jgi:hypothetical protein